MTNVLNLLPSGLVASGVQRAVYLHPTDHTKLIKVLKPSIKMPRRYNFNGVMDRWFPSTRLRQIRKEYTEYLRVMLNHPEPTFRAPMSHMFGFVSTNVGLGCLTESVMMPDGTLGETLGAKAKAGTLTDHHIDLLNDTISRLFSNDIRASDMNPNNFVFGHRDNGSGPGPEECVLVDGFGDIHAIPVRSMAKWSNRLGLIDSCERLGRNTKLKWHKDTQQFSR
ncbi:YrbL family protein [Yoonia maritima]|uniref:YrbL family protein n=1 Tax=Yoonia maritima TaxID=1435347 RepID=UPI000D0FB52F|nr:YrbL family protein [Yoonia maritima]